MPFEELKLNGLERRTEDPDKAFEIARAGYQDRITAGNIRRQISFLKELGVPEEKLSEDETGAKAFDQRADSDELSAGVQYDMGRIDKLDPGELFDLKSLITEELRWIDEDMFTLDKHRSSIDESHKELYDSKVATLSNRKRLLTFVVGKIEPLLGESEGNK